MHSIDCDGLRIEWGPRNRSARRREPDRRKTLVWRPPGTTAASDDLDQDEQVRETGPPAAGSTNATDDFTSATASGAEVEFEVEVDVDDGGSSCPDSGAEEREDGAGQDGGEDAETPGGSGSAGIEGSEAEDDGPAESAGEPVSDAESDAAARLVDDNDEGPLRAAAVDPREPLLLAAAAEAGVDEANDCLISAEVRSVVVMLAERKKYLQLLAASKRRLDLNEIARQASEERAREEAARRILIAYKYYKWRTNRRLMKAVLVAPADRVRRASMIQLALRQNVKDSQDDDVSDSSEESDSDDEEQKELLEGRNAENDQPDDRDEAPEHFKQVADEAPSPSRSSHETTGNHGVELSQDSIPQAKLERCQFPSSSDCLKGNGSLGPKSSLEPCAGGMASSAEMPNIDTSKAKRASQLQLQLSQVRAKMSVTEKLLEANDEPRQKIPRQAEHSSRRPRRSLKPAASMSPKTELNNLTPAMLERMTHRNTALNNGYSTVSLCIQVVKTEMLRPPSPSTILKETMKSRSLPGSTQTPAQATSESVATSPPDESEPSVRKVRWAENDIVAAPQPQPLGKRRPCLRPPRIYDMSPPVQLAPDERIFTTVTRFVYLEEPVVPVVVAPPPPAKKRVETRKVSGPARVPARLAASAAAGKSGGIGSRPERVRAR
ncbi:hypothetical protein DFJ73DRAFT_852349 [Zopfochytrium polystomum]|nr:hypothetical protein DFJ73DRAFT_852349 [Zopfochytrium polystomum]